MNDVIWGVFKKRFTGNKQSKFGIFVRGNVVIPQFKQSLYVITRQHPYITCGPHKKIYFWRTRTEFDGTFLSALTCNKYFLLSVT